MLVLHDWNQVLAKLTPLFVIKLQNADSGCPRWISIRTFLLLPALSSFNCKNCHCSVLTYLEKSLSVPLAQPDSQILVVINRFCVDASNVDASRSLMDFIAIYIQLYRMSTNAQGYTVPLVVREGI